MGPRKPLEGDHQSVSGLCCYRAVCANHSPLLIASGCLIALYVDSILVKKAKRKAAFMHTFLFPSLKWS